MMSSPSTELATWVQTYLRGPGGNLALADGLLLEPRDYFGPLHLPLNLLPRCCGPEPGMPYPEGQDTFETRVEGLRKHYRSGGAIEPLIVNFRDGAYQLNDGNHRHEAFLRDGRSEALVVVWTTGEKDKKEWDTTWGPWLEVENAWREGLRSGREGVVGALVKRDDGRIFAQRRSLTRKTFPGCWDLVGGHLEPGESPRQALVRELAEETGWNLGGVLGLRRVVDWHTEGALGPVLKREFVLAVTIQGSEDTPRLEQDKATEGRWFGPHDLELLNENRLGLDTYVYDLIKEELAFGASPP